MSSHQRYGTALAFHEGTLFAKPIMTQPFEAEDLFRYKSIPEIHACPNSNHFSCCIEAIDQAEDATVSKLWILSLNGAEPRQMTTGASNDFQPRWSADGSRLGFISDREGSTQVFYIPRDGGEARQATHFDGKIVSFRWHPGAEELLVIASVAVDPNLRGRRSIEKAPQAGEDAPQVIWKLPYKADGTGYTLNRETHLFTVDLATAETSQLTDGAFDVRSAEWSPNGERIAYVRTREGDEAHRSDLWVIDADGSAAQQLTSVQAQALFPVWSPDGKWIVFSGTIAEGDAQVRLWMVDVDSEGVDALGDESIEMSTEGDSVQFTADGSHIVAIVAHRGVQNVAEISVPDGTLRWITRGDRQIQNVAISGDRLIYASVTPTSPIELFCCKSDGSDERQMTNFNSWWDDRRAATLERRCFSVPDGAGGHETIDGWLIRPLGVKGPTPLLVDVHGGPASYVLFDYPPSAYWSMLWSDGWSILALNAVGSSSYGRPFCDRLRGQWGRLDLPQQVAAVRQLQEEGVASADIGVTGKSYGGFMACWAVGHTQLFRAAVAMAPVVDIESHLLTSDSGYYSDPYSMNEAGMPLDQTARDLSPWRHVAVATTPTLILHGENDERCPRTQAESFFVALRRRSKAPSELVIYPGATHRFTTLAKPSHRIDVMRRLRGWLTQWTG